MVRIMRESTRAKNVAVTSSERVEDLRLSANLSNSPQCSLSSTLQSFIISTLQRSADMTEASTKKSSRRQRPRRRISRTPSPVDDYQTQFPALSASTSSSSVPVQPTMASYSAMAALICPASVSNLSIETSAPESSSITVPTLSKSSSSKAFAHTVHTWLSGSDNAKSSFSAPSNRLASFKQVKPIRSTFDGLFSNNHVLVPCQNLNESPKRQISIPRPVAAIVRSSLSKVNNTQLLLPDYLLQRLVCSNPAVATLIKTQSDPLPRHQNASTSSLVSYQQ